MKLVALCGLHGAGKDTVADALPAQKFAFADALYREVAEAFGVSVADLKCRSTKEAAQLVYSLERCKDRDFVIFVARDAWPFGFESRPRSPRWALQRWGDYRRAQDPDYFVNAVRCELWGRTDCADVITDCRFPNEAAMIRQLGGQIWQVVRHGHNPPRNGHASENDGSEFSPDVVIINNGTLDELRVTALQEWNK